MNLKERKIEAIQPQSGTGSVEPPELALKAIDYVFDAMRGIMPASFSNTFKTPDDIIRSKKQWLLALKDGGVFDMDMIKFGIKRLRATNSGFIPSSGTFVSFCRESLSEGCSGAFNEALKLSHPCSSKNYSSEVVKYAALKTRIHELSLKGVPSNEIQKTFEENYRSAVLASKKGLLSGVGLLEHRDERGRGNPPSWLVEAFKARGIDIV